MTTQGEELAKNNTKAQASRVAQFFEATSYLQYPFMLIALGYTLAPYFTGFDTFWTSVNKALIFAGLGISFSTLQDTSKTQNNSKLAQVRKQTHPCSLLPCAARKGGGTTP